MIFALLEVILPVFLVIGFGYAAVRTGLFSDGAVDGLVKFTQNFAIPCLLFRAISTLDIGENFDGALLGIYYSGAIAGFFAGLSGARFLFRRNWEDSVAIGFCCLFANSVLLGLPISEMAWGADALGPNYAIVALHAPFCYGIGIVAMEIARAGGGGPGRAVASIFKAMFRNALVIGIALGLAFNLAGASVPGIVGDALDMMVRAALPAAVFGLGGVLARYRPEGDALTIVYVCGVSLALHPAIVWLAGGFAGLSTGQFRSSVLTAAMPPGVNAYVFASMYGAARRVAASSVLAGTALSIPTLAILLSLLP